MEELLPGIIVSAISTIGAAVTFALIVMGIDSNYRINNNVFLFVVFVCGLVIGILSLYGMYLSMQMSLGGAAIGFFGVLLLLYFIIEVFDL